MLKHFSLNGNNLEEHRYHTVLTYALSHNSFFHYLFNSSTLYFFGRSVELMFGPQVLFNLYFSGAMIGGLMQINQIKNVYGDFMPVLGGSAGLAAVMGYYVMMFPNSTILLFFIPVPAWLFGIGFFGYSFIQSATLDVTGGVGHLAHFGGLCTGLAYYMVTKGR
jgi:membrane associated rhomboid family serine protease